MRHQTLSTVANPSVTIQSVPGDLRVVGWERQEISARTNDELLELNQDGEHFELTCDGDLILSLPRDASLTVVSAEADVNIRGLRGAISLQTVGGDLALRDVGPVQIENVSDDLALRGAHGEVEIGRVAGDTSLRDVHGNLQLENAADDLYLRNVQGNLTGTVAGDAVMFLEPKAKLSYSLNSGGNILLRLPRDADAKLKLTAGSPEDIQVNLPNIVEAKGDKVQNITLGKGAAKIALTAGGSIHVTSKASEWESAAEFGDFMGDIFGGDFPGIPPIPPVAGVPSDLNEQIRSRIRSEMGKSLKAQMRAEAAAQRAQRKMESAVRRAEHKVRAADRRGRGTAGGNWSFNRPFSEAGPTAPDLVSDEERLTILRMLEEKKISLEEAEKLLAALEGRGE